MLHIQSVFSGDKTGYRAQPIVSTIGSRAPVCATNPSQRLTKYNLTLEGLVNWYNECPRSRILPLVRLIAPLSDKTQSQRRTSLRTLDFMVRTYLRHASKHSAEVGLKDLYDEYKQQIRFYTRRMFDPFCRSDKILLWLVAGDKSFGLETCVAQINFVKWVIERGLLLDNSEIPTHMRPSILRLQGLMNERRQRNCKT
jgi:hypothetical protein